MKEKRYALFVFFLLSTLAFYFPTRNAGFVTDFYGWLEKFANGSYKDVLTTFGWHANQQVAVFFHYTLYRFFGINSWGWYICFSLLHATNAFLAFRLFQQLFEKFLVKNSSITAFIGSVLFLLSPYQAEVLVWRVCVHYLLSALWMLIILHELLNFLESGNRKYFLRIQGLFLLSLFTLEISLITPFLMLILIWVWNSAPEAKKISWKDIVKMILPLFGLIGFFFLMNKILLNEWIGHYGASVHLNFSINDVISKFFKYFLKYLLFFRFWDYNLQVKVFSAVENPRVSYIILTLCVLILTVWMFSFRKLGQRWKLAGTCLLLFFVALGPVITLYMVTLLYGENDRYGYVASIFFWMMVALVFSALPKKIFYVMSAALVGISIFFLIKMTSCWSENQRIYSSLLDDFRWYDKEEVIILNIPDNYRGLYMYRIYNAPSGLEEGLDLIRKKPFAGEMYEVTQFNMMTLNDRVSVKTDSTDNFTVTFKQWGNWWWKEGIGNGDYENEKYKVHFDGNSYHIVFKSLKPNHAVIYQVGDKWKEVSY